MHRISRDTAYTTRFVFPHRSSIRVNCTQLRIAPFLAFAFVVTYETSARGQRVATLIKIISRCYPFERLYRSPVRTTCERTTGSNATGSRNSTKWRNVSMNARISRETKHVVSNTIEVSIRGSISRTLHYSQKFISIIVNATCTRKASRARVSKRFVKTRRSYRARLKHR